MNIWALWSIAGCWLMSRKKHLPLAVLGMLLLAAMGIYFLWPGPVSRIGSWKIYPEDIAFREQIIHIEYPEAKHGAALAQLEKSARYLQILESYGVTVTKEDLVQEADRIEKSSRDPGTLKKIKSVFGENQEAYLKNYVFPVFIQRILPYEFFPRKVDVQKVSLETAQRIIAEVQKDPARLQEIAEKEGLSVRTVSLSLEKGLRWENTRQRPEREFLNTSSPVAELQNNFAEQAQKEGRLWYESFLNKLADGDVLDKPLNYQETFLVIQRVRQTSPDEFQLRVLAIPKITFEQWLTKELEKY